jgi:TrmH family RNA methyltransferase
VVGRFRALHQPKGRLEQGLLLLDGTHLLQEALRLGLQPERVLATPAWIEAHRSLSSSLSPGRLQPVSEVVLAAAATTAHPDGVVGSLPLPRLPLPICTQFALALDRIQDPGNLGTLMRTALAAGVEEVWLGDGADPWQPKVLRASAGAALALPHERLTALAPRLQRARADGVQVVAAVVPKAGQVLPPYWELDWSRPTVVLLGNEGAGLAPDLLEVCSHRLTIPHSPAVESLNVAVAAAPLLLERWRQRQTHRQQGRMPGN